MRPDSEREGSSRISRSRVVPTGNESVRHRRIARRPAALRLSRRPGAAYALSVVTRPPSAVASPAHPSRGAWSIRVIRRFSVHAQCRLTRRRASRLIDGRLVRCSGEGKVSVVYSPNRRTLSPVYNTISTCYDVQTTRYTHAQEKGSL